MKHDITKLPIWAQNKIQDLESQISTLQTLLDERAGDIYQPHWTAFDFNPGSLPKMRAVANGPIYATQPGEEPSANTAIYLRRTEEGAILIQAPRPLIVGPCAANSVSVRMDPTK